MQGDIGCKALRYVQDMDLMELPEGTPEVVPIVCNGVPGHFVVRTKTAVYEHFREDKVTLFAKATGTSNPWMTAVHIAAVGVGPLLNARTVVCQDHYNQ